MERDSKRDIKRPREDRRSHNPNGYGRYAPPSNGFRIANGHIDRDRSRSPPRRDQRDDRRRDRTPPRGPARGSAPSRNDRDRQAPPRGRDPARNARDTTSQRGREPPSGPRHPGDRAPREPPKSVTRHDPAREAAFKAALVMALDDKGLGEAMQSVMGFKTFATTKETKVPGNDRNFAVYKEKKIEYRQYMNRKGGFNRPLSPSR